MSSPVSTAGILGTQAPGDLMIPSTTPLVSVGTWLDFMDPYYGAQRMVYGKAAAAQECGSLVYLDNSWVATDIPNTANTGYPVAVAKAEMAINTYGWYITSGLAPWSATASVAAGTAIGLTGAGTVGANTAGKQILGARVAVAGTGNFTRTGTTSNGSGKVMVTSSDGMFVGLTVSGTGIPASTEISAISANGNEITINNNATASGTVTLTFTYTNYLLVQSNAPFVQGAIT